MNQTVHNTPGSPIARKALTRRLFLKSAPPVLAVGALAAVPAIAASVDPMERLRLAQAEFIAAAKAAFPTVEDWRTSEPGNDAWAGMPFMFALVGHNWTAKNAGGLA